jgi:hypothetical protein
LLSLRQKWVPEAEEWCLCWVERGRCARLTTLPPSVSRLSRQCGIINVSQPYRSPRRIAGIDLAFFYFANRSVLIIPVSNLRNKHFSVSHDDHHSTIAPHHQWSPYLFDNPENAEHNRIIDVYFRGLAFNGLVAGQ